MAWTTVKPLGQGAMSRIEQVVDESGRIGARKVLLPSFRNNSLVKAHFSNEGAILSRLAGRRGIIPLWEREGDYSFVLAYCPFTAQSWPPLLGPRNQTYWSSLGRLILQVAEGLEAFHRLHPSHLHRDVKPENILVDEKGNCYLSDFGYAFLAEEFREAPIGENRGAMGTPAFFAPEMATEGAKVGPEADFFALGVAVYRIVVGELPWRQGTGERVKEFLAGRRPLSPAQEAALLPPGAPPWMGIAARLLDWKARERPGFIELLDGIQGLNR